MKNILETLRERAIELSISHPCARDVLTLRALSRTCYVMRLDEKATTFHLHYIVAQTLGQGCSYYDPDMDEPGLYESLIGRNALEVVTGHRCINIALLDAVFASLKGKPSKANSIEGTNIEKADLRANIVCHEAELLLKKRNAPKRGKRMMVVNVGVVGNFLAYLMNCPGLEVRASDFYRGVVGSSVHGVQVEHGSKTLDLVADADVAIVTGMTLANDTLDSILNTARENSTSLLIFAETGANFASEYCNMGVDTVVSEPFPFYLTCAGSTQIDVYRRANSG